MADDRAVAAADTTSVHRTLLALAAPVLASMMAEPIVGLVDTAFVAQLGSGPLAALGVGTSVLSAVFWIFNFLHIGTQTEVAQAWGRDDDRLAADVNRAALAAAAVAGAALALAAWPLLPAAAHLMGAAGPVASQATAYMQLRLAGAPAVLVTMAAFGTLRGHQLMRLPMVIALAVNGLNVVLDALLIFGPGPFPALGVAGAALASTISQWAGAVWAVAAAGRRHRLAGPVRPSLVLRLLAIGRDLFVRTGLLTLFLVYTTRVATGMGVEAGAAHQAIRQFWLLAALVMDAFAVAGQSMVGYRLGAGRILEARKVAAAACLQSAAAGVLLAAAMAAAAGPVAAGWVPEAARGPFGPAWLLCAAFQPVCSLAFATDGVHWGTGDFAFLRNQMILASGLGAAGLAALEAAGVQDLWWVWAVIGLWVTIRAAAGVLRVWPGIGRAPLAAPSTTGSHAP